MAIQSGHADWRLAHARGAGCTGQFGLWLESNIAHLYKVVTPVTASLLRWWFGDATHALRSDQFHADERQAIVDAIVSHELLGPARLFDTFPAAFMPRTVPPGIRQLQCCLRLKSGASAERVVQALLVWQLLNRLALPADETHVQRFTRRFLIAAAGKEGCEEWRSALNDMLMRYACEALLVPPAYRQVVHGFLRDNVCTQEALVLRPADVGLIAVVDGHAAWDEAAATLRNWTDLMMFDVTPAQGKGRAGWMHLLTQMARSRRYRFTQVGLLFPQGDEVEACARQVSHATGLLMKPASGLR